MNEMGIWILFVSAPRIRKRYCIPFKVVSNQVCMSQNSEFKICHLNMNLYLIVLSEIIESGGRID